MAPTILSTMPHASEEERATLLGVEDMLRRHPYMRVDLASSSPLALELEHVMSVRLGLLHTRGVRRQDARALHDELLARETALATSLAGEPASERTAMRYETALLLHSAPDARECAEAVAAKRARATSFWERQRRDRRAGEVVGEKLRQNRDFFRHGAMLPFYWIRRRRIRKLVPRAILEHAGLRRTYFSIEQVGPLVDNFAFGGTARLPLSTEVGLADITFLYMQLADELLDELAAAAGGHDAAGRLVRAFYRVTPSERPLHDLALADLRRYGLDPDAHVTKFDLTLAELFNRLAELAGVIDHLLGSASDEIVRATMLFLHHCFQTYLDEVELCARAPERRADRLALRDAAWHFYRKNNMVMMLWLDLRARLLGLSPSDHAGAIRRWGYLLATFQIFDDLKDIALDLGKQPSYPLQIAAHEFPAERAWIEHRFRARRAPLTRDEVSEVNLGASQTVRRCMQWSRLIALAHFDNTLAYAWDQRWRKSWMSRRRSFNPESGSAASVPKHVLDRLVETIVRIHDARASRLLDDELLAFALDTAAYDGAWQIYLALFPDVRAMYRFATLRMWMSVEEKARAAKRLLHRHRRRHALALLELAERDIDHEVVRDGLEAFSQLLEVERLGGTKTGGRLEERVA